MHRIFTLALAFAFTAAATVRAEEEWTEMFDGKSLAGWKVNESPESFTVKDGVIVVKGQPRSHLFYVGDGKPYKNFEFQADVMTKPGSNSGIYFHTKFQESGWPKYGYEAQVNNTHGDPKKTASLYAVENVLEAPAKDNEWFTMNIRVDGKKVIIKVNGETQVDYLEPEGKVAGEDFTRVLDEGTFALQAHDPDSVVMYKNLRVRRLP